MNFTQIGSTHCAPHPWISKIFALHVKGKDTGLVPHIQDFVSSLKCPWRRRFKKADIQSAKRRGWWEASFWYSKSGRGKDREYLKRRCWCAFARGQQLCEGDLGSWTSCWLPCISPPVLFCDNLLALFPVVTICLPSLLTKVSFQKKGCPWQ